MQDPPNPQLWQLAVDAAHALLTFDAARQYGLVTGGPGVNIDRCRDILARGAAKGLVPAEDAVARLIGELSNAPAGAGA